MVSNISGRVTESGVVPYLTIVENAPLDIIVGMQETVMRCSPVLQWYRKSSSPARLLPDQDVSRIRPSAGFLQTDMCVTFSVGFMTFTTRLSSK